MTDHTPGPWTFSEARGVEGYALILGGEGQDFGLIAEVTEDADARLIAAAPDLLDACNGLLGLLQMVSNRDDISPSVRDVLATNHRVVDARAALSKVQP